MRVKGDNDCVVTIMVTIISVMVIMMITIMLTCDFGLVLQVGEGWVGVTETVKGGEEHDVGRYNCSHTSPLPSSLKLTMACGYNVTYCGYFNSSCTRGKSQAFTLVLEHEGRVGAGGGRVFSPVVITC